VARRSPNPNCHGVSTPAAAARIPPGEEAQGRVHLFHLIAMVLLGPCASDFAVKPRRSAHIHRAQGRQGVSNHRPKDSR
jgi:hypothetical protein